MEHVISLCLRVQVRFPILALQSSAAATEVIGD